MNEAKEHALSIIENRKKYNSLGIWLGNDELEAIKEAIKEPFRYEKGNPESKGSVIQHFENAKREIGSFPHTEIGSILKIKDLECAIDALSSPEIIFCYECENFSEIAPYAMDGWCSKRNGRCDRTDFCSPNLGAKRNLS